MLNQLEIHSARDHSRRFEESRIDICDVETSESTLQKGGIYHLKAYDTEAIIVFNSKDIVGELERGRGFKERQKFQFWIIRRADTNTISFWG